MPRKPLRTTKSRRGALTRPEKHLLLTGRPYPPKGNWGDYGEKKFRAFFLSSPACRSELKQLWQAHREQLLSEWTGPGLPWAAKEFDAEKP